MLMSNDEHLDRYPLGYYTFEISYRFNNKDSLQIFFDQICICRTGKYICFSVNKKGNVFDIKK